ncbi:helix-turn-helix domain-containing protein [Caballeronia choica]|uniref:helix-turn-helix domain-containing protein n=1 Tax=Caballeronia choica TaxID=326476 RepID=UPI000B14E5F1|nr:helix-turn-helix domain-containing protein [Caballeronia choica]
MYEKMTGVPAPIKRPDRRPDPQLHHAAMRRIVEAAGHKLAAKATVHISTFAAMGRLARPVVSSGQAFAAVLATGGNKSDAAKSLGISRPALYRLLAK